MSSRASQQHWLACSRQQLAVCIVRSGAIDLAALAPCAAPRPLFCSDVGDRDGGTGSRPLLSALQGPPASDHRASSAMEIGVGPLSGCYDTVVCLSDFETDDLM